MSQEQESTQQSFENNEKKDVGVDVDDDYTGCTFSPTVKWFLSDAINLARFDKQLKGQNINDEKREKQLEMLSQIFAISHLSSHPSTESSESKIGRKRKSPKTESSKLVAEKKKKNSKTKP